MTRISDTPLENLHLVFTLEHALECSGCVKPNRSMSPEQYGDGKAGCNLRCIDQCWCENKPMWSDRPVTLAECNAYYPGGSTPSSSPYIPTLCEGMTSSQYPASKVLDFHCTAKCVESCGGLVDPLEGRQNLLETLREKLSP